MRLSVPKPGLSLFLFGKIAAVVVLLVLLLSAVEIASVEFRYEL